MCAGKLWNYFILWIIDYDHLKLNKVLSHATLLENEEEEKRSFWHTVGNAAIGAIKGAMAKDR